MYETPNINMKFNTHANTKEYRPCQIATATTVQTTNNKTKQTLKNLPITLSFCFHISVVGSKDVAQRSRLAAVPAFEKRSAR